MEHHEIIQKGWEDCEYCSRETYKKELVIRDLH